MIVDPVRQVDQQHYRLTSVCGGAGRNKGSFVIERGLRLTIMAECGDPDAGFRISFTLTAERPRS